MADLAIEEGTATDYFSFGVPEGARLYVEVAPVGSFYSVGPALKDLETVFGPGIQDLAFEVLAPDGAALLASVNERPPGKIENLVLCDAASFFSFFADYDRNFRVDWGDLFFFHPYWQAPVYLLAVDFNDDLMIDSLDLMPLIADWNRRCEAALPAGTYFLRVFATTTVDDVQRYQLTLGVD